MEEVYNDKYSFIGEWYDNQSCLLKQFNVLYYPFDNTVEMIDLKNRKMFIRRVKVDEVSLDKFYIGATLKILGRLIKIVDFACEDTKKKLNKNMQLTFAMIKPIPTNIAGKILTHFHENGLNISRIKKVRLTSEDVKILYKSQLTDANFPFLLDYLSDQLVYGIELVGKDAVINCINVLGDKDPAKASPGTIRSLYGTDPVKNCVHAASTLEEALESIEYFFASRLRPTPALANCALCLVKPHAVGAGALGAALQALHAGGFDVTALASARLDDANAAEFFEVYKGVVPEYKGMVDELASGLCVAMEVVANDKSVNTAVELRKLVGPSDPEIARLLRPHTMRAKLGKTKVKNAIHCSDLPEDGLLEVEYFFKILDL